MTSHGGNNSGCEKAQAALRVEGTSYKNVKLCMEHFLHCHLKFYAYDEILKDNLLEINYQLNLAAHDKEKLREIIITEDMPSCTENAFRKVINYLKEKYNQDPMISQFPTDFVVLGPTMRKDKLENFRFFKEANAR